jgi:hypothetical protein
VNYCLRFAAIIQLSCNHGMHSMGQQVRTRLREDLGTSSFLPFVQSHSHGRGEVEAAEK